jgi:hypothetical protein
MTADPWSPSAAREAVRTLLRRCRTKDADAPAAARLVLLLADDRAFDSYDALADATRGWPPFEQGELAAERSSQAADARRSP